MKRQVKALDSKNLYIGKGFLNPEKNKINFNNNIPNNDFRFKGTGDSYGPLDQFNNPLFYVSLIKINSISFLFFLNIIG